MRPLVEALTSYPCANQTGRYLPECNNAECKTNMEGHPHHHFGDIRNCGDCPICKAKAFGAIKKES